MLNEIQTGDARVLSAMIPDCSVDLIFTDPVYQNTADYLWLAEIAERAVGLAAARNVRLKRLSSTQ